MRNARLTGYLVRRVALRGQTMVPLAVLLAVGTAVVVFLALTSFSALQVVERQHDRRVAATVRIDPSQSSGTDADLRIVDPRITNSRRWGGHDIRREFYAAGSTSAPIPPGVPRVPTPHEYFASPDLIALIRTDATAARLFASQRLVGEIGSSGLVQPHQLRAVIGVDSSSELLTRVNGFGGTAAANVSEDESNPVLDASVGAYVLALVWLPAAFFVIIVAKLAAFRRRRRAAALHLIGYPKWRIQVLHFAEALVVCLPAASVGLLTFVWLASDATTLPGTSFGFYPADARLPLAACLLIAMTVLVAVCVAVSSDIRPWGTRRRRRSIFAGLLRPAIACLVVGLALLALPTVAPLDGPLTPAALWTGTFLSAVGIATAGPSLVTRLLGRRVQRAAAPELVGRRMAAYRVSTSLRLASVMSVIVVLLLGSQAFAAVLNGGSATDWEERVDAQGYVPVMATDLTGDLSLSQVAGASGAQAVAELRTVKTDTDTDIGGVNAVFATCSTLVALTGGRDRGACPPGSEPVWLGEPPIGANAGSLGRLALAGRRSLELADVSRVLQLPGLPGAFTGALLLPPGPTGSRGTGSTYFLVVPSRVLVPSLAAIASLDETVQFDLGALDRHNPDTQTYPAQVEWLGVGAVAGLGLAFLSLLVVSLGEAEERSARMRALRVLGASRRALFTAHLWCVAAPLVLVGLGAVVVGWLAVRAMRDIDERAYVDPSLYGLVTLAVLIVAGVVSLATWRAVLRSSEQPGSISA